MTLLAEQTSVNDKSEREFLLRELREHVEARETRLALGSGLFNNPDLRLRIDQPARTTGLAWVNIIAHPNPPFLEEGEITLGSHASAIDWRRTLLVWKVMHQSEGRERAVLAPLQSSKTDIITPAAEQHAKFLGLYGVLILTKEIVHETIPSMMALVIDVKEDPEDEGYTTVCFTITVYDSVEQVMQLDNILQGTLYKRLPTQALPYFSFSYQFE